MDRSGITLSRHKDLLAPLFVLSVTLLVYTASFSNQFVLDDEVVIVNNPQTLSLRNIPDVLLAPDVIKPYYRPLNRATYLLDYRIAGMNPAWYHGVNVFLHLGNVFLTYLLCRRLLPDRPAAVVAALFFGVHPVNSEAANFISARNTLLALFFSLASLLAFLDAREKGKRFPLASGVLFFCGLLSKETAFMLVAVIALCTAVPLIGEGVPMKRSERILFLLPYLLSSTLYFVLRSYSLHGAEGGAIPDEGLFRRLAQNYHVIPQCLGLLLFPVDLTIYHKVPRGGVLDPPWVLPTWILLLATVSLILRSRNRTAIFCLAWFAINYAPISNIVPIPSGQLAERFFYTPAVGFFVGIGALFSWFRSKGKGGPALWGVTTVLVVTCSALTAHRNLEWRDNLSLFSSGVRNDPTSPGALYNLGTAYRDIGDLESAREAWEKALVIDPGYADVLTQMGTLAAMQGDLSRAEKYYLAALQGPPGVADPDRSMAHYNLGKIYETRKEYPRAVSHYRRFLETVPLTYLEYKADAEGRIEKLRNFPSEGLAR